MEPALQRDFESLVELLQSGFILPEQFEARLEHFRCLGLPQSTIDSLLHPLPSSDSTPLEDLDGEKPEGGTEEALGGECQASDHLQIKEYVQYLLSNKYQMKQEGIKPNYQGFVNFMSICRTPSLSHLSPELIQSVLETHKSCFSLNYSFDNHKLQIKLLQPLSSPSTQGRPSRPERTYHGYGVKNWIGFPVPEPAATKLKEHSGLLGRRLRSVHLSLGWAKTNKQFYEQACQNIHQQFRSICQELRSQYFLTFSRVEVLGKEKNKLVVIYDPTPKHPEDPRVSSGERFKEICEKIWEMWRKAGEEYARQQGGVLRKFKNPEGTLEYGEVKGRVIYEMRAIKVKFHVTMGVGHATDMWKIENLVYPPMEIPAEESYVNPGKSTAFKVPK